jgi:NTP pyrophosphatase (non-canonical NTP hydrolase)
VTDRQNMDSYAAMLAAVQAFHDKHRFREEVADLFILLIGTAIAAEFDLRQAFWDKMEKIQSRQSRMINGRIRVSEFKE